MWTPDLRVLRALGVYENFYRDLKLLRSTIPGG
jgi:hypothetical protein